MAWSGAFVVSAVSLATAIGVASTVEAQAEDRMIFVTTYPNAAPGSVSSMRVSPDGSLTLVDTVATSDTGPQAVSISPDGQYLAVSHGTAKSTENVDVIGVNGDGTMSLLLTIGVPDSPLDLRWITDRALAISQAQFGSGNSVGMYRYDEVANTLTEFDREDAGDFHSDLALDPLGRTLFANDSAGSNRIFAFAIEDDGSLSPDTTTFTGSVYPLGMDISEYGDFLYAGGGISNNGDKILGYLFGGPGESLTALPGAPFVSPGDSPKQALPTLNDRVLFVAHGRDATVRSFTMNADGSIASTGHVFDVGLQGTCGKLASMDNLLFVPDNSTATDGKSGVYVFRIATDGSFTMVGDDLFSTGQSTPNSIATWNPARSLYLGISDFVAGQTATFTVVGGRPNAPTALAYSTRGLEKTFIQQARVSIDLKRPKQLGKIQQTDADGRVAWQITLPDSAKGVKTWLQALQFQRVSNAAERVVE